MSNILRVMKDCLSEPGEAGSVEIEADSLMQFKGWIDEEKAKQNFELILAHVKRLPKPFLDPEGGWTFLNLPFYDDGNGGPGEQWGQQRDAGLLILLCTYYGLVQDPLKTLEFKVSSLADAPGGVSYFSFNTEDFFLGMVRKRLGLK